MHNSFNFAWVVEKGSKLDSQNLKYRMSQFFFSLGKQQHNIKQEKQYKPEGEGDPYNHLKWPPETKTKTKEKKNNYSWKIVETDQHCR